MKKLVLVVIVVLILALAAWFAGLDRFARKERPYGGVAGD